MVDPRRAEFDAMQAKLASRNSISHFARASISVVWALIAAGAAGKLIWDLKLEWIYLAAPVVLVALGLLGYGLVHWARGRRELDQELKLFAAAQRLRAQLRLDDPAALLPR
jgi:hypothetical protein